MKRQRVLTTLALVMLIMSACAAPPTRPASAPAPAPEDALQGVYGTIISKEDLSANKAVNADSICENAGVFTYTLSAGR